MNQFVKGAKNLALALSFVSICACSSVENADLNVVNKELGPREKGNVSRGKGNVANGNENFEQITVEDCIDENGCVSWELLLNKFNDNLKDVVFTVDKNGYKYVDLKCKGKRVSFSILYSPFFLDRISVICKSGGVLKAGENFEKIKIFFVKDNKIQVLVNNFEGRWMVWFISKLGRLSPETFNLLFDCGNMVIRDGKINGYSLMGLGDPLFDHRGSREIRDLFLKGFSLLFKGEMCKFVYCSDTGNIGEGNCIGIKVGDKGVVVLKR